MYNVQFSVYVQQFCVNFIVVGSSVMYMFML